ncbi:unnamed protein product, partial [Amoebophrya sp. A120]
APPPLQDRNPGIPDITRRPMPRFTLAADRSRSRRSTGTRVGQQQLSAKDDHSIVSNASSIRLRRGGTSRDRARALSANNKLSADEVWKLGVDANGRATRPVQPKEPPKPKYEIHYDGVYLFYKEQEIIANKDQSQEKENEGSAPASPVVVPVVAESPEQQEPLLNGEAAMSRQKQKDEKIKELSAALPLDDREKLKKLRMKQLHERLAQHRERHESAEKRQMQTQSLDKMEQIVLKKVTEVTAREQPGGGAESVNDDVRVLTSPKGNIKGGQQGGVPAAAKRAAAAEGSQTDNSSPHPLHVKDLVEDFEQRASAAKEDQEAHEKLHRQLVEQLRTLARFTALKEEKHTASDRKSLNDIANHVEVAHANHMRQRKSKSEQHDQDRDHDSNLSELFVNKVEYSGQPFAVMKGKLDAHSEKVQTLTRKSQTLVERRSEADRAAVALHQAGQLAYSIHELPRRGREKVLKQFDIATKSHDLAQQQEKQAEGEAEKARADLRSFVVNEIVLTTKKESNAMDSKLDSTLRSRARGSAMQRKSRRGSILREQTSGSSRSPDSHSAASQGRPSPEIVSGSRDYTGEGGSRSSQKEELRGQEKAEKMKKLLAALPAEDRDTLERRASIVAAPATGQHAVNDVRAETDHLDMESAAAELGLG